jgi:DNA topoisomerase-3
LCERTQLTSRACKFKVGKVILQQPLDATQITKLLAERRTDVLGGFISKKTGKPFKAALVLDEKERVAFEFPEREAGA